MTTATALVAVCMLIVAIVSYKEAGSWLFPPVVFALYWSAIVFASLLLNFRGYSLSFDALLVFLGGCLAFATAGHAAAGLLAGQRARRRGGHPRQARKRFVQVCVVLYNLGLLALVPVFVRTIQQIGNSYGLEFAVAARWGLAQGEWQGRARFFQSLTSLGSTLVLYAAWLYEGSWRDRAILALSIAGPLLMSALTFARSPVYALAIGVLAILAFRKTIRTRTVFVGVVLTLCAALLMGTALHKGPDVRPGESPIAATVDSLALYYVGGPLGFSQVMDNPTSVGQKGQSLRFFTQIANRFGLQIKLPDNVAGYCCAGLGNVYTAYYAYWLDWGPWGVLAMALCGGFLAVTVYTLAKRGSPIAGAAVGLVTSSILNSAVVDGLFGSSTPWLLIVSVGWLLWHVPLLVKRSNRAVLSERDADQVAKLSSPT